MIISGKRCEVGDSSTYLGYYFCFPPVVQVVGLHSQCMCGSAHLITQESLRFGFIFGPRLRDITANTGLKCQRTSYSKKDIVKRLRVLVHQNNEYSSLSHASTKCDSEKLKGNKTKKERRECT
jgi:hypothetical protein